MDRFRDPHHRIHHRKDQRMKARIRIKLIDGSVFVRTYDSAIETEEGVMNFLGLAIKNGDFIDFETGRTVIFGDHIVSIESSGLTPAF
jgi:hypothetical protein